MSERNPTARATELARQQWGLALAALDLEGQRYQIVRMLEEAIESVQDPDLKRVLVDLEQQFGSRT